MMLDKVQMMLEKEQFVKTEENQHQLIPRMRLQKVRHPQKDTPRPIISHPTESYNSA